MAFSHKLALLADYGYQIAREHNVDKLIPLLAQQSRQLLEAHHCSVFILDKKQNELWDKVVINVAVAHHERYDATGYPYGLSGEAIPIKARIVRVQMYLMH